MRAWGGAVIALWLLAGGAARADEFDDRCARAELLTQTDQYSQALRELEAAYQLRQAPRLLYAMATVHRKLGHAAESLDFYQRYLTAESQLDPTVRIDVEAAIAQLRPLAGQAPVYAPPAAPLAAPLELRVESRGDRGMIAGGAALMGTSWGLSVIAGALTLTFASGIFQVAGGVLLIPVAGPFVAGFMFLNPTWSLLNIFLGGGMQVAGLAMLIVGAKHKSRVVTAWQRLSFAPLALSSGGRLGGLDGGGLSLGGRF